MAEPSFTSIGSYLKQRLQSYEPDARVFEYGEVESCSDTIVQISGLSGSRYGELLEFEGGAYGLTLDLHLGGVGAALLGGKVSTASVVRPTGRVAEICVGDELLGRVVDPVGRPLDGRELTARKFRPIESPAPHDHAARAGQYAS